MAQIAPQLDFKKEEYAHPSYRFNRVLQMSGLTTETVTVAGGQEMRFEIPVSAVNLSRSYITFQFRVPAAPNPGMNNVFMDCFPHFSIVQLYTRTGIYICDLNEAANYTSVVYNAETKLSDFLCEGLMGRVAGAAGLPATNPNLIGSGSHFQRSNLAVNPAGNRPAITTGAASAAANIFYTEPAYVNRSVTIEAGGGESVLNCNVCFPLNHYHNTIFATDKDIYFGEIVVMRIVWSPSIKIAYTNTVSANLTVGAAALTVSISVRDIALNIATEKNPEIVNQLQAQIAESKYSLLIPYVITSKNSLTGTSQNVSLRFNRGHGRRLTKIYHTIFNSTESSNTAYDHNNVGTAVTGIGRCASYYTLLDSSRLQEFDINCDVLDDWNLVREELKGSVLQSSDIFKYNWFHRDRFDGLTLESEGKINNYEVGLDLNQERRWDIYCTTVNSAFTHYNFAITQKLLTITPEGITCI